MVILELTSGDGEDFSFLDLLELSYIESALDGPPELVVKRDALQFGLKYMRQAGAEASAEEETRCYRQLLASAETLVMLALLMTREEDRLDLGARLVGNSAVGAALADLMQKRAQGLSKDQAIGMVRKSIELARAHYKERTKP